MILDDQLNPEVTITAYHRLYHSWYHSWYTLDCPDYCYCLLLLSTATDYWLFSFPLTSFTSFTFLPFYLYLPHLPCFCYLS